MDKANQTAYSTIEDPVLAEALNELGRSVNLVTTYSKSHPAAETSMVSTLQALHKLFIRRKKISMGSFNGLLTIDGHSTKTTGPMQKSLERRLGRLGITGLKIARGISLNELTTLLELLSGNDADAFQKNLGTSGMAHIQPDHTRYEAVQENQAIANKTDLEQIARMGGSGVLVLDDEENEQSESQNVSNLHIEQIVAFLKGDIESDSDTIGEELSELASDPDKFGRMILESVAIRQSVNHLSGESLNDIVLGCLRRTYDGLHKQPAFQSAEGKVELKKALLLLEESVLEKLRAMTGEDNPELDRNIVQAVREMDEKLSFETAAAQYMEHREAIEQDKEFLHHFIQEKGAEAAEILLQGSGFPGSDWRKIVVESIGSGERGSTSLAEGLSTLTSVFEKLEQLMKAETTDGIQVKNLLGQANENLEDTLDNTKEKLAALSSTIGGQAHTMSRSELLTSLSEVAQELMQPLTAINASVEMMLHGFVGKISEEQQDLLTLASHSGEHLKFLMDMLINIVGCPTNKGIDNRYHTTSDQVQLMKDAVGQEHLPFEII